MLSEAVPTVSVACRAGAELAAIVKAIVALPVPLADDVTDTHDADGIAVHAQSVDDVTRLTLPLPPAADALNVVGLSVYVQPLAW